MSVPSRYGVHGVSGDGVNMHHLGQRRLQDPSLSIHGFHPATSSFRLTLVQDSFIRSMLSHNLGIRVTASVS